MAESARLTAAISTAIDKGTGPEVSKGEANVAAVNTVAAMKTDPVLANATNQEPLVQSRIVVGGSAGVIASIVYLVFQIVEHRDNFAAYDQTALVAALVTLWGAAFTLYGRLTPGLKPLFYGWFGRAT